MRKFTPTQYRDIFFVASGVALFVYILLRAINVSISIDEQGSYFMFVTHGEIFPEKYDVFSANNHALNTALMCLTSKWFGPGILSLRLPNVLAGALYIFSIAMMARRIKSSLAGALVFLFATTNPFLIEYFGLARGYGLANGFLAFALWQIWKYCDDGYRWKNLAIALCSCVLVVFANYSYLNIILPLAGCIFLISVWQPGANRRGTGVRFLQAGIILSVTAAVLAIVIPISLRISAAGGFWSNTCKEFWTDSFGSAIDCSLMNVTREQNAIQVIVSIAEVITALVYAVILWWTIQQWRRREFTLFPLLLAVVWSFTVLFIILEYHWLDTPMPVHRICFYFFLPWLVLVGIGASLPSGAIRWTSGALVLVVLIQLSHLVYTVSLEDQAWRPQSIQVDDAIAYLRNKEKSGERIRLGYDHWAWASGMEFYRQTLPLYDFDLTLDTAPPSPLNEYFLCTPLFEHAIDAIWVPEQTYLNGNILYHNSAFHTHPVKVSPFVWRADTTKGIEDWSDVINFGGIVHDSIEAPEGTLIRISYDIKTVSESTGHINVMVFRNDSTIFDKVVDIYPVSAIQIASENIVIVPQLKKGDNIILSLSISPANPEEVKDFKVTIEGY